ncbi:MAG: glycoside hydrolase [Vallitaleaceae bacterium]|jgi:beta-N-acetylhexosaminidase|nr:glycoside hydrolase [Vallitaleaceae bacterium]
MITKIIKIVFVSILIIGIITGCSLVCNDKKLIGSDDGASNDASVDISANDSQNDIDTTQDDSDSATEDVDTDLDMTDENDLDIVQPNESGSYDIDIEGIDQTADEGFNPLSEKNSAILKKIAGMTIEEKIGQFFIVDLYSLNDDSECTEITDILVSKFNDYHIGGVIFFGANILNPTQVISFINDMQDASDIPLFIAVDEEGGIVRRIGSNEAMRISQVPTAIDIGASGDTDYAYTLAYNMGLEIKNLGFNMDFAPVADVNTNPDNPIIGKRAFSDDEAVVADMVVAFASGLQDAGVLAVAKHFPGHGDTSLDTHTGDVYVEHDMARLESIELVPFRAAIDMGIGGIMSAHIILENVTGTNSPATFSKELLIDLLRDTYGFTGLVITDALTMGAVSDRYSTYEDCVNAILAGNDILLMPDDLEETYNGIMDAYSSGKISEARINASVYRILAAKYDLGLEL